MSDGSYKCLTCQTEELQDRIVRVTPNSDRTEEILAEQEIKQEKELQFKRRESEIRKMNGKLAR